MISSEYRNDFLMELLAISAVLSRTREWKNARASKRNILNKSRYIFRVETFMIIKQQPYSVLIVNPRPDKEMSVRNIGVCRTTP